MAFNYSLAEAQNVTDSMLTLVTLLEIFADGLLWPKLILCASAALRDTSGFSFQTQAPETSFVTAVLA